MDKLALSALNIKCSGCVSNIEDGLSTMSGINSVEVNLETGAVLIIGNNLNRDEICAKLSELSYPEK